LNDSDAEFSPDVALTPQEVDILGEIGNMCMGASATTLYTLMSRSVSITTPEVQLHVTKKMWDRYDLPFVAVAIQYVQGVSGRNVLLLKEDDVRLMTDLLMGGDGNFDSSEPLGELHLSAISEIMNQMMGASATALANMLGETVNISPPEATVIDFGTKALGALIGDLDSLFVSVGFTMEIEGLLKSEIYQMMTYDFAKQMVDSMLRLQRAEAAEPPMTQQRAAAAVAAEVEARAQPTAPLVRAPAQAPTPPPAPSVSAASQQQPPPQDIHPVQYTQFDEPQPAASQVAYSETMDMLYDVPLQVSVELGRAKRSIREILDFNIGSLIVLDKLAGEPVDVLVNGKLIAKGEVVVIDESYGVRITEIITPANRLATLS
jgi:flagellar motor switch protein FliN/FliY